MISTPLVGNNYMQYIKNIATFHTVFPDISVSIALPHPPLKQQANLVLYAAHGVRPAFDALSCTNPALLGVEASYSVAPYVPFQRLSFVVVQDHCLLLSEMIIHRSFCIICLQPIEQQMSRSKVIDRHWICELLTMCECNDVDRSINLTALKFIRLTYVLCFGTLGVWTGKEREALTEIVAKPIASLFLLQHILFPGEQLQRTS